MTLKDEWAEILNLLWANLTGFWDGEGDFPSDERLEAMATPDKSLEALATHTYKAVMGALPEMKEGSTNRKYTENDQPSSEWGYNAALTQVKQNLSKLLEIPLKEE